MSRPATLPTRRFRVIHRTRYAYALPVDLCHNEAHLEPRVSAGQRRIASRLLIDPAPDSLSQRLDYFGNPVHYFAVRLPRCRLVVTAESAIEVLGGMEQEDEAKVPDSPPWEAVRARLTEGRDAAELEARELALASPMIDSSAALHDFALPSFPPERPLLEAVADLSRRIHREFAYDPEFSTIATPLAEVLERRRGVCQDFAHLAIGCIRALGLPARYVSGYIQTSPAPDRPAVRGADASHAWFAAYAPGVGWFDFDPTNDQIPPRCHITTAWGRDYGDVAPLKGVLFGGGDHTLEVEVEVEELGADG